MKAKRLISQKYRNGLPDNIDSLIAVLQAIVDNPNQPLTIYQETSGLKERTFFRVYDTLISKGLIHKGPISIDHTSFSFLPGHVQNSTIQKFSGPATRMAFYLARFKPKHKAPSLEDLTVEEYAGNLGGYLGENVELLASLIYMLQECLAISAIILNDYTLFKNGPQVAELSPLPTDPFNDIFDALRLFEIPKKAKTHSS